MYLLIYLKYNTPKKKINIIFNVEMLDLVDIYYTRVLTRKLIGSTNIFYKITHFYFLQIINYNRVLVIEVLQNYVNMLVMSTNIIF